VSDRLVIIGGGEHARVVAEAARSAGHDVIGFVDPQPCAAMTDQLGLAWLGNDDAITALPAVAAVLGIGAVDVSPVRRRIVERLSPVVTSWRPVVHAAAWVSPSATIGEGAVVMAGAVVNAGARLGRHTVVNTGVVVEHDVVLGDFAQLAPGVTIGGGVVIGADAFVGLGASVRDHITIGTGAFVGMGAVLAVDAPSGSHVRALLARIAPAKPGPKG
jgi:sugar O-acyltransferase (sialic acid O-acetyltransferase NeuD family)